MSKQTQKRIGKARKQDLVKDLSAKLTRARAVIFADPAGLKHKQLEELRKKLKPVTGEFTIAKNALLKRALETAKKTLQTDYLHGPTAILLSFAEEVTPIKTLLNFFKTAQTGQVKGGLLGNTTLEAQDVEKFANLPTRGELLAKLVGQLNAPMYGLHHALSWNLNKLVWTLDGIKNNKL